MASLVKKWNAKFDVHFVIPLLGTDVENFMAELSVCIARRSDGFFEIYSLNAKTPDTATKQFTMIKATTVEEVCSQ